MFRSKLSFYLCLHICHILLKYSFLLLSPLGVQISLMYHEMAKYKRKETDEELMEHFDSFVRAAVLEEGNKLRAEKGYPFLTVSADEKILDENGKIDPAKLEPIVFDPVNNVYLKLGEKAGNAFQDGMKLK